MKAFSCIRVFGLLASVACLLPVPRVSSAQGVLTSRVRRSPKYPNLDSFRNRLFKSNSVLNSRLQRASIGKRLQFDDTLEQLLRLKHREDGTFVEDTDMYLNAAPWTRTPKFKGTKQSAPSDIRLINLASDNVRKVIEEGNCAVPIRRVIPVMSKYPEPTRKYWPLYVLLHRCGEDSGCCLEYGHTCAANATEEVDMHFFVYTKGSPGERAGVRRMSFTNHTSCACKPRKSTSSSASYTIKLKQTGLGVDGCKCVANFAAKRVSDACVCDCFHRDKTCIRYKKGRRFFSPLDSSCITGGECTKPECEYGPYLDNDSRCPRRRERIN